MSENEDAPLLSSSITRVDALSDRLDSSVKASFALGASVSSSTHTCMNFFAQPFLLDVAHVPPFQYGIILVAGRIFDAFTDPLIGLLCSNTRKRPWLIYSILPCACSYVLFWWVPPGLQGYSRFTYYLFAYCSFQGAFTCFYIPYTCITMLLSSNSKERDLATAYRMGVDVGTVLVVSVAQSQVVALVSNQRIAYLTSAGGIATIIIMMAVISWWGLRSVERKGSAINVSNNGYRLYSGFRRVLACRSFVSLSMLYLFSWCSITTLQSNLILYFKWSVNLHHIFQWLLVLLLSSSILFIVIWQYCLKWFSKSKVYCLGTGILVPIMLSLQWMPRDQEIPMYFAAVVAGAGVSVAYLLPWSMLSDVISDMQSSEREQNKSNVAAAGSIDSLCFSFFVFFQKLASGVSLGISSLVLHTVGYVTEGEPNVQPPQVNMALRILVGPIPAICLLFSFVALYFYPLRSRNRSTKSVTNLE